MRFAFTLVLALVTGCASSQSGSSAGGVGTKPPAAAAVGAASDHIAVGQSWQAATDVAKRAGYKLHNASELAMSPTPDGFYLDLPAQRGLIVLRNPENQTVKSVEWISQWNGAKSARVFHKVRSVRVPPADESGK